MNKKTLNIIRNNTDLYHFLREYSYWYKELNRNPDSIKYVINDMKTKYKLKTADKLEKVADKMEEINTIIDLLK